MVDIERCGGATEWKSRGVSPRRSRVLAVDICEREIDVRAIPRPPRQAANGEWPFCA